MRNFEPSLAASQASATAIAYRFQRDAILLVLRSPTTNVYRPPMVSSSSEIFATDGNTAAVGGSTTSSSVEVPADLKVSPISDDDISSLVHFAPSWVYLHPQKTLCVMTGLASDVEHLIRVIQNEVDVHYNIYGQHLTTHSLVTGGLSHTLMKECLSGRRPWGIQGLFIGVDDDDDRYDVEDEKANDDVSKPNRRSSFGVYTVDPSGAWQSWGSGMTAVGKYAKTVQEQLAKKRLMTTTTTTTSPTSSLRDALELVLGCWIETCKSQNINVVRMMEEDDFQVLVLQKKKRIRQSRSWRDEQKNCQLYGINDDDVRMVISERCRQEDEAKNTV